MGLLSGLDPIENVWPVVGKLIDEMHHGKGRIRSVF
jgi:hypothetical protein